MHRCPYSISHQSHHIYHTSHRNTSLHSVMAFARLICVVPVNGSMKNQDFNDSNATQVEYVVAPPSGGMKDSSPQLLYLTPIGPMNGTVEG